MPMFICDSCSGIENTACGNAFTKADNKRVSIVYPDPEKENVYCSECTPPGTGKPKYPGGTWHGEFLKVIATEELVRKRGLYPTGNNGFVHLGKFEYLRSELEGS